MLRICWLQGVGVRHLLLVGSGECQVRCHCQCPNIDSDTKYMSTVNESNRSVKKLFPFNKNTWCHITVYYFY